MTDHAALLRAQIAELEAARPKLERAAARSEAERSRERRSGAKRERETRIAVLDMETDEFDNVTQDRIFPFVACLHSKHFPDIVIWEDDPAQFVEKVLAAINALPHPYTIYAHNGGKFDFMFLIHQLRGEISFKGRGIMTASVGEHKLRDSFHIIPERLASYKKDDFDYEKLNKKRRHKHKAEIISYLRNDCVYLLDIIETFIEKHGMKLSIGQASMASIKEHGIEVERINRDTDELLRRYYFGGRVEMLAGAGLFIGDYKLYDVNSMYPKAMADFQHPTGKDYIFRKGRPGPFTVFVRLICDNYGALVCRDENGDTSARLGRGEFYTTIWEYEAAKRNNLICNIQYLECVDCLRRGDFSAWARPVYNGRIATKERLKQLKADGLAGTREYDTTRKDDMVLKFLLNNGYGKYAMNPDNYCENYITDIGQMPPAQWLEPLKYANDRIREKALVARSEDERRALLRTLHPLTPRQENRAVGYAIWERPSQRTRYNNVGTAASITGAARAILMDALCKAEDPIYCDTDSIICKSLPGVELHPTELGAWDLEQEYSQVIIACKKTYAATPLKGEIKYRSKGTVIPTWDNYLELINGGELTITNKGPTIDRLGRQVYVARTIRASATPANSRFHDRVKEMLHA